MLTLLGTTAGASVSGNGFDLSSFCYNTSPILQIVGWILTIIKIAMPLIIILMGILDFGKAVTGNASDEIKKSAKSLMFRALAGVIIFFIPTIVMWVFSIIADFNATKDAASVCERCVLAPWGQKCKNAVDSKNAENEKVDE